MLVRRASLRSVNFLLKLFNGEGSVEENPLKPLSGQLQSRPYNLESFL